MRKEPEVKNKFEYCESSRYISLQGNCFFFEDTAGNTGKLKRYEKRRRSAYLGSRMHFFRSLWNNSLQPEGFNLFDNLKNDITYDDLVNTADSLTVSGILNTLNNRGKF
jgi:hypothetical protein